MNILMLTPDYPPNVFSGIGTHVHALSTELANSGHSITVIVIKTHLYISAQYTDETNKRIRVIHFNEDVEKNEKEKKLEIDNKSLRVATNNCIVASVVLNLIASLKYDIVHVHDPYPAIVYDAIVNNQSISTVSTVHAMTSLSNTLIDAYRRYIRINADKVIAVSNALKTYCEERYGENNDFPLIQVIPNGITISSNKYEESYEKIITFCARMHPSKGCDILLKSFADVLLKVPQYKEYQLYIIGEGPEERRLHELSQSLGISENVIFTGYIANVEARKLMRKAYIHVVPSILEGFSITTLEAMSESACVLATDAGGLKEFVKNNVNGLTVAANSVEELSNGFLKLLSDSTLRNHLAQNGYDTACNYKWSYVAERTVEVYKEALLYKKKD